MTDRVYISPTGVMDWLKCPAKQWFAQTWELRREPDNFGSQVHRHMEDGTDYDRKKDFESVASILPKLRAMESSLAYKVIGREVEQSWELFPGVWFKRVLDVLAVMPDGYFAIVDYKSSSRPWKTFAGPSGEQVAPKALSLQGAGYLLSPPVGTKLKVGRRVLTSENWPGYVLFLNGPAQGDARWFTYEWDEGDEDAFLRYAQLIGTDLRLVADGAPPLKNRGDECDGRWAGARGQTYGWECPWKPVCYDLPGWQRLYKTKVRRLKK